MSDESNELNSSQEQEQNVPEQPREQASEKVGDILHRERVVKRISLETVAKDLKLNISYIKAIESSSYDQLPADPYVRVYIRSIASYLMLDPDGLIKQFMEERGISEIDDSLTDTQRIKISVAKDRNKSTLTWKILILLALLAGVVITYLGYQYKWIKSAPEEEKEYLTEIDSSELEIFGLIDTISSDSTDTLGESSLAETLASESGETDSLGGVEDSTYVEPKDTLVFVLKAIKDTVWVRVFYDGKSWKNLIRAGQTRLFRALDSINVHVGDNSRLIYYLNQERLKVKGSGVRYFRLDSNGLEIWNSETWKEAFSDRL